MGEIMALDIVLVPPKQIIEEAKKINAQLSGVKDGFYPKMGDDCVPHISLFMAFVDKDNIEKIKEDINTIVQDHKALQLKIPKIGLVSRPDGLCGIQFQIERTDSLQALHEALVKKLECYRKEGDKEAFFNSEHKEIADACLKWPRNYATNYSFENFDPHITLGFGEPVTCEAMEFVATNVSLFHLGNRNTCRKLITSFELKQ
jgi:2'-5' RNA ligase